MDIENGIKDVINQKLEEGIIEKLVSENLEKSINEALKSLMGHYGDVTKVIEEKIKSVLLSQLSGYDYSKYIVKLDCVLTEILQKTSLDNKKILENFKELMVEAEIPKAVKVSDIFTDFKKHVAKKVDTSELEVIYDDGPSYENVSVTMEVEYEEERRWSSSDFKYAKIILECEKDESLNFEIRISKFSNYDWSMSLNVDTSISSLRYLDEFKIYLLKLHQRGSRIEIDKEYLDDEVKPKKEPEAEWR